MVHREPTELLPPLRGYMDCASYFFMGGPLVPWADVHGYVLSQLRC